jgi:hypothetical protein
MWLKSLIWARPMEGKPTTDFVPALRAFFFKNLKHR